MSYGIHTERQRRRERVIDAQHKLGTNRLAEEMKLLDRNRRRVLNAMEQDSLRTARRLHHIRGENIVRNEYPPTPELERFRMDETEIQLKTVRHYERRNKEKMVERRLPKLKMKERISRNELLMEEMSVSNGPVYQRNGKPVYGVLPPISKTSSIRNDRPNKSVGRTSRISLDIRSNETITYPHDGNSATNGPTVNNSYKKYQGILQFRIGHQEYPNAPHTTQFPMPGSWRSNQIDNTNRRRL